jgi:hypothetical protein
VLIVHDGGGADGHAPEPSASAAEAVSRDRLR